MLNPPGGAAFTLSRAADIGKATGALSPQPVRKMIENGQRMPTDRIGICAGQGPFCYDSQRLPPMRGEFELYFDL